MSVSFFSEAGSGGVQVQSVLGAMRESHNRVEAAVCLYARMVDKENLWLVLYALKVHPLPPPPSHNPLQSSFCPSVFISGTNLHSTCCHCCAKA